MVAIKHFLKKSLKIIGFKIGNHQSEMKLRQCDNRVSDQLSQIHVVLFSVYLGAHIIRPGH